MSSTEAKNAEIDETEAWRYSRSDLQKANLSPPSVRPVWLKMVTIDLENGLGKDFNVGDRVGVITPFKMPSFEKPKVTVAHIERVRNMISRGEWRRDSRAKKEPWAGKAIAEVLELDISKPAWRAHAAAFLAKWIDLGYLKEVKKPDPHRQDRVYVVVGPTAPVA